MNEHKLIVALDVPGLAPAEKLVKKLAGAVKTFKIGKELFTTAGPDAVRMVQARGGRVFLDLKFHDIPNTAAAACAAAARLGVALMNVHALGGADMMRCAAKAARDAAAEAGKPRALLLGVTVLTSLGAADLRRAGISRDVKAEVAALAKLAALSGLDGVVASGQEIALIRRAVKRRDFCIVTPGVRPLWAAQGDQKRVVTPKDAIERGADYIVVGRPITGAPDPRRAAEEILREMSGAKR